MRKMLHALKARLSRKHSAADTQPSAGVAEPALVEQAHLDAELADLDAVRGSGERLYAAEPQAAHARIEPESEAPAAVVDPAAETPEIDTSLKQAFSADSPDAAPGSEPLSDAPPAASAEAAPEGPASADGEHQAVDAAALPAPAQGSAVSRLRGAASARWASWQERLNRGGLASRKTNRPKYAVIPIRVIMGYLPEVSERDAREYALGMAEKHFEQIGMAYFSVFEHERGFVYEIHEGGDGFAYAPEILKYFESQGPFRIGEHVSVHIRTATRMVEVERLREGLAALVLPESSDATQTEWLEGTDKMEQALNRRTGLLLAGAALFVTGFAAMMVAAFLARFQPYEDAPPVQTEYINAQDLPLSQWSRLESVQAPNYVRALRYRAGKWEPPEVSTDAAAPANPVPATPATPAPAAQ